MEFSNRIQTSRSKALIVFMLIIFLICLAFMVVLPFLYERVGTIMTVLGYMLSAPFAVISLVILLDSVFNYDRIEGEEISHRFFFKVKRARVKDITFVKDDDKKGFYDIYVGNERFTSLNKGDPSTEKMLYAIERMTSPKVTPTPYVDVEYTYEEEVEHERREKEEAEAKRLRQERLLEQRGKSKGKKDE